MGLLEHPQAIWEAVPTPILIATNLKQTSRVRIAATAMTAPKQMQQCKSLSPPFESSPTLKISWGIIKPLYINYNTSFLVLEYTSSDTTEDHPKFQVHKDTDMLGNALKPQVTGKSNTQSTMASTFSP